MFKKHSKVISVILTLTLIASMCVVSAVSFSAAEGDSYYVVGTPQGWDPLNGDPMTDNGDGTWTKVYTGLSASGGVKVRNAQSAEWNACDDFTDVGPVGPGADDAKYTITEPNSTLTVLFDEATQKVTLTVTAGSDTPTQPETDPTQPETTPTQPETTPTQPETTPTDPPTADLDATYNVFGVEELTGFEWVAAENPMTYNEETGYWEITFEAIPAGNYAYKVCKNGMDEETYNEEGPVTGPGNNAIIYTGKEADITILFDPVAQKVSSVTDPEDAKLTDIEHVYRVAGSSDLCGSNWEPDDDANLMTETAEGSGIYTKTYTGVAFGTYIYKITEDGGTVWYGAGEDGDDNVTLDVEEDNATVVITFNKNETDISKMVSHTVTYEAGTDPSEGSTAPTEAEKTTVNGKEVKIGDIITFGVTMQTEQLVSGINFKIPYDSTILKLTDETLNMSKRDALPIAAATGSSVLNFEPYDGETAIYFNAATPDEEDAYDFSAPGSVLIQNIKFEVIGTGDTTLALDLREFLAWAPEGEDNTPITDYEMIQNVDVPAQPTNPSDQPTQPSDQPTNPSDQPTNPSDQPTQPSDQPTNPSDQPTDPSGDEPVTEPSTEKTPGGTTGKVATGDSTSVAMLLTVLMLAAGVVVVARKRVKD